MHFAGSGNLTKKTASEYDLGRPYFTPPGNSRPNSGQPLLVVLIGLGILAPLVLNAVKWNFWPLTLAAAIKPPCDMTKIFTPLAKFPEIAAPALTTVALASAPKLEAVIHQPVQGFFVLEHDEFGIAFTADLRARPNPRPGSPSPQPGRLYRRTLCLRRRQLRPPPPRYQGRSHTRRRCRPHSAGPSFAIPSARWMRGIHH